MRKPTAAFLFAFAASLCLTAATAGASTIVVNSAADTVANDGLCTLREALNSANTNTASGATPGECIAGQALPTVDTIAFDIPGDGVHTISPASALPPISQAVFLDGYTQRPCASNPAPCSKANTLAVGDDAVLLIEIDGTALAPGSTLFQINGASSTVRGLVINRLAG